MDASPQNKTRTGFGGSQYHSEQCHPGEERLRPSMPYLSATKSTRTSPRAHLGIGAVLCATSDGLTPSPLPSERHRSHRVRAHEELDPAPPAAFRFGVGRLAQQGRVGSNGRQGDRQEDDDRSRYPEVRKLPPSMPCASWPGSRSPPRNFSATEASARSAGGGVSQSEILISSSGFLVISAFQSVLGSRRETAAGNVAKIRSRLSRRRYRRFCSISRTTEISNPSWGAL